MEHETKFTERGNILLKLKSLRLARSMTQDQVADKLGITTRAYQYIEYGQKKPSYSVIIKLQDIFKEDIETLLTEHDN